jgi:hypothetical protein
MCQHDTRGEKAKPLVWLAALLFELYGFRNNSAAWRYSPRFRRASSLVTVVPKKPGSAAFCRGALS